MSKHKQSDDGFILFFKDYDEFYGEYFSFSGWRSNFKNFSGLIMLEDSNRAIPMLNGHTLAPINISQNYKENWFNHLKPEFKAKALWYIDLWR